MPTASRLLPLLTLATLVLTIVFPLVDSGSTEGPRVAVNGIGADPSDPTGASPFFIVAWLGVVGCAASVWFVRSSRWWAVAALLVSGLLGVLLFGLLLDPPSLHWDGADDQGRPTGGFEVAEPALGTVLWAVGTVALVAAGVLGLIGRRGTGSRTTHPR